MKLRRAFLDKELIVFDLDGTLAPSKSVMDKEMSRLIIKLLRVKKIAVIGGGRWEQFRKQFLSSLRAPQPLLKNLFLFPTTSTSFYRYHRGWKKVYAHKLPRREREKIIKAFKRVFRELGYHHPKRIYGPLIEDRGTQITFSAVGQAAPVRVKAVWNRKQDQRSQLMAALKKRIPEFEIRIGGLTSIDVTRRGIDKAYGIRKIVKGLDVPVRKMLFVGDALYPGGNDYAARRTGILCVSVSGPKEAKKIIRFLIDRRD